MNQAQIQKIATHLIMHGYVIFDMPALRLHIQDVLNSFKQLLAESPEYKEQWKFFLPELTKKPDHGLIPPKGEGFDLKWFFHFRKGFQSMLLSRLTYDEYKRYETFFEQLEVIQALLHLQALPILRAIDEQLTIKLTEQVLETNEETHVVRLLEYIYQSNKPDTDPMASLHTDQSFLTMQWYQSHPGLILRDYHDNLVEYQYEPGKVLCFFGKKSEPASEGKLIPVEHWVDSRAHENRYAGIYFIHTPHPSIEMDKK